jgi:hypothetical protein
VGDDAAGPLMALEKPRVRRSKRGGGFDVRIPERERVLLRGLPGQLRELLEDADASDPAVERLYPSAYPDDAEAAAHFDDMVRDDLTVQRLEAAASMERTIDATHLREEELLAWLSSLNDLRLVLGTRLNVTEETTAADFTDPGDSGAFVLYSYLSFLVGTIVEALS